MSTILQEDGAEAYQTRGGVTVSRKRRPTPYADAVSSYVDKLDERRGASSPRTTNIPVAIPAGTRRSSIRRSAFPPSVARSGSKPITVAA